MLLSRVLRKLKFFYFNSELLRNPLLFSLLIHWILASTFLTLFPDILKMFSSLPSFLKNFLNLFNVPSIVLGEGIIELHLLWCSWSRKEHCWHLPYSGSAVCCPIYQKTTRKPHFTDKKPCCREVQRFAFYVEYE